jgi:hypothetical protein
MRLKSLVAILLLTLVGSFANACLDFNGVKVCAGATVFPQGYSQGARLLAVNPNNNMATVQSNSNQRIDEVSIKALAYKLPSMGGVSVGATVYHKSLSRGGMVLGFNPFNGEVAVISLSNQSINFFPACELGLTDVCLYFQTAH